MKPATLTFSSLSSMTFFNFAFRWALPATLWLTLTAPVSIPAAPVLGTRSAVVGPGAGTGSVVLNTTNSWNNTANDAWLHLDPIYQNGSNSLVILYTCDANASTTPRSGSLSIGGDTLTVTQAGSSYLACYPAPAGLGSLPRIPSIGTPIAIAVDKLGNVYFVDDNNYTIKMWAATNNTSSTLVNSNLNYPQGIAVDDAGNLYIAESGANVIKKWSAATRTLTNLVSTGLNFPTGVAVDADGNVYIADQYDNAVKKWTAADSSIITLVSGLNYPHGVAVDIAGNVYIADQGNSAIEQWSPINGLTTLATPADLLSPNGVAVDGAGNVYISDWGDHAIKKWNPADSTVKLVASLNLPECVAVDTAGNLFSADINGAIYGLPLVFVDPTFKSEASASGTDSLSSVLPASALLTGPFAPTSSDSSWLTLPAPAAGIVNFSFSAGANRMAYIELFDQTIPVLQGITAAPPVSLATDASGNLILSGTGGPVNGSFTCVSSTDLTAPLATWQFVSNGAFASDGSFNVTNAANASLPGNFYTIRIP